MTPATVTRIVLTRPRPDRPLSGCSPRHGQPPPGHLRGGAHEFLDKYDLKLNNAVLAEEKHAPMYDDMVKNFDVEVYRG